MSLSTVSATKSNVAGLDTSFKLRPYQKEAVKAILGDFKTFNKLGCILPTGAGKTEIMLSLCDKFLEEYGGRALILSHMGLLVGQTSDRAEKRFPNLKVGWLKAGHTPDPTDDVIVGTMQSARIEEKLSRIKEVTLIIVDEAHFITASSYQMIIQRNPEAKILGLTATPYKAKRLMTNHFERVSYCAALSDMIDQGYLLPPKLIAWQATDNVTGDICGLYKTVEMGKKAIVFMPTVDEAYLMDKVFKMEGVRSACIVGETPEAIRTKYINEFTMEGGNVDVLTTCDVLTAGFDAPCTEVIIMGSKCGSPTSFMQRVGRGLRKYKDKKECRVYFLGKTPKLEREFYEKMCHFALNAKKEKLDIFEQLEWAKFEGDDQEITFCTNMLKIHNDVKDRGFDWLANCIREETLGRDLMGRIDVLHDKLRGVSVKATTSQASVKQKAYLEGLMGVKVVDDMKTGEANALISALVSLKNPRHPMYGEQWNVPTGIHTGKHIKDVPFPYMQWVMTKQPRSQIAVLFHRWNSFKKEQMNVK